jgi:curved DNA-binding protein CbpA
LTGDRYRGFVFNPVDLAEDVDLDVERRKEILFADAHLAPWSHFELLGIPWNAGADAARAAYLEKVKVFHPDRYPRQRLGSYRPRLERIVRRLTEARDVLADEEKRTAYARKTAPPDEFARMEARKLEDERRAAERRSRLSRQNPLLARASRVGELMRRARSAFDERRFGQAANDLQVLLGLDPDNAEAKELAAEARRRAGAQRASDAFDQGLEASLQCRWGKACEAFRRALETDPGHVKAAIHGVRAALALGDGAAARELGEAAVRAGPRVGAAHEALGLALAAQGASKEAKRALERALELDPGLETARERLRKLRWRFLG